MSEPVGYFLDEMGWRALQRVKKGLYGDGSHLTPDHRRDLANALEAVMFNAIAVREDDIVPK